MHTFDETSNNQIDDTLDLLKKVIGDDLLGVYVYGSLVHGGLQKFSDIDLFVVSKRPTTKNEKEALEKALLHISGIYAVSKDKKPIELIIAVQSDINPWHFPPTFDFLYGDWLRKEFESGNIEPWPTKELPNMALTITQLLLSHVTLLGPTPHQLFAPVPYKDFFNALTSEVTNLTEDLDWDTRNVLLTLSRIWCTLETDLIQSKSKAVEYAIQRIPQEYKPVLKHAKEVLHGEKEESWQEFTGDVKACSDYMVQRINDLMKNIEAKDDFERSIQIK